MKYISKKESMSKEKNKEESEDAIKVNTQTNNLYGGGAKINTWITHYTLLPCSPHGAYSS